MEKRNHSNRVLGSWFTFFTFTILIFLQLQLYLLATFSISISILGIPLILRNLFHFRIKSIGTLFIILCMFIPILNFLLQSDEASGANFVRSFGLLGISAIFYSIFFFSNIKIFETKTFEIGVKRTLYLLVSLSAFQFLAGYQTIPFLSRPFFQFTSKYQFIPDLNATFNRAAGFYIEPSFNALVCLTIFTAITLLPNVTKRNSVVILCLVLVTTTFSLSGILVIFGLYIFAELRSKSKNWLGNFVLLAAFFAVTSNVFQRILSISEEGTSANFRIAAPIKLLLTHLPAHPFGLTNGSLREVMADAGYLNGVTVGTSLDNGWFLIVYYFGLIGILFLLACIFVSIKACRSLKQAQEKFWIVGLAPFLSLGFTGGIFLPDFVLLIGIMIYCIRRRLFNVKSFSRSETHSSRKVSL